MTREYTYPEYDEPRPIFKSRSFWELRKENQTEEKCSNCGKTFTKKRHGQRRCPECIQKAKLSKNRCACGRKLSGSDKVCSFCKTSDSRINAELQRSKWYAKKKPQFKCEQCGREIPKSEWELFVHKCFECYTKKVRIEGI